MHSYRIAGLAVASEIELPGLIAADGATPQVSIRLGAVPSSLDGADLVRPTYEIAGDLLLLHIPGIARFLLNAGRELTVAPQAGKPVEDVTAFIIGSVFGILMHQRDQVVLHASAVRVNGRAVLFCGDSGAGKSTLAAALGQRGYAMLTDDVCAVTIAGDGVPLAQPDGRRLKLWESAIARLDLGERRGGAVRSKVEKFYIEPLSSSEQALPIAAMYALRETRASLHDGIERLDIAGAARQVRRNAYRRRMVRVLGQQARYLKAAAAIGNKAGVYFLTRPFDFAAMPDVVARLEQHWRELGLLEAPG